MEQLFGCWGAQSFHCHLIHCTTDSRLQAPALRSLQSTDAASGPFLLIHKSVLPPLGVGQVCNVQVCLQSITNFVRGNENNWLDCAMSTLVWKERSYFLNKMIGIIYRYREEHCVVIARCTIKIEDITRSSWPDRVTFLQNHHEWVHDSEALTVHKVLQDDLKNQFIGLKVHSEITIFSK